MLANLLIGLREGLEASLVIGILVAYLVKIDRRDVLPKLWAGVGVAVGLSVLVGVILETGLGELEGAPEEILAGSLSIAAAGLVTWMVFWMAKTARNLKGNLHREVDRSIGGTGWGLMFVAFLAVGREGIETALFIWAAASATGETWFPLLGAVLGLGTAAFLGYLIYLGALRLNLRKFFTWSGALLVLVAGGVLVYGIAEWQEAGLLPGHEVYAFDVTAYVPADSWYGVVLHGTIGFTPEMTWLQIITWALFVAITLTAFLRMSLTGNPPVATAPQNSESKPKAQLV
jgi:high-affinity iron transporter